MSIEPLSKTFDDDPHRCHGTGPAGQCEFRATPGTHYCRIHTHAKSAIATVNKNLYELDETAYIKGFAERVNTLGHAPQTRSLRSEIGILRATLERVLRTVEDDEGLSFRSGELLALTARIESLEKTSLTLEKELGQLMSLDEAKQLAGELLEVLFKELDGLKEKEQAREAMGKDLIERIILSDEVKEDLTELLEPLGIQSSLERIADAFGDIVNGQHNR